VLLEEADEGGLEAASTRRAQLEDSHIIVNIHDDAGAVVAFAIEEAVAIGGEGEVLAQVESFFPVLVPEGLVGTKGGVLPGKDARPDGVVGVPVTVSDGVTVLIGDGDGITGFCDGIGRKSPRKKPRMPL